MPPRTRSQTAADRSKRSRDPSPERPSKRSKSAHDQCQSPLFAYPFVLPLLVSFLSDLKAALIVRACKAMKPIMSQFVLSRSVTQAFADEIIDPSRMSCFQVSHINSATYGDVRKHRHLKYVRFDDTFNSPLQPGCFGDRLRSLIFGDDFNQPIGGMFPEDLQVLYFGTSFDQPLTPSMLPSSITSLAFNGIFNHPLKLGMLPSSLKTLILGRDFNFPILPGVLPPTLTQLCFGGVADQPLLPGALPSSLRYLKLGVAFDQPILHGMLPFGLTHLTMSVLFNHPLAADVIPSTVTHLTFGIYFDQVLLPGVIPSSVMQLQLGRRYEQTLLPNSLPGSIKHLIFCCDYTELLDVRVLPNSIEHMEVGYFGISNDDDEPLILLPSMIPSSVTQLTLHRMCAANTVLPSTITKLVFGPQFNEQIPVNFIPSSVTHLRFGRDFVQTLTPEMLPLSVKYLTLGESFEPRMWTSCPPHVTHLCFDKAMTLDQVSDAFVRLSKTTIYMAVHLQANLSLSGLSIRICMCRSTESETVTTYTSSEPIDIENPDFTKLQTWMPE